jgi:adenosine deaminase
MSATMQNQDKLPSPLNSLITALPKAELHVHLEGSIQPETLLLLARRNGVDLGYSDVEGMRAMYRYQDFSHFLRLYGTLTSVLRQPEDFRLIAHELGMEAARQGTHYLEVTFSPATHYRNKGTPFDEMMDAIAEGAQAVLREVGVEMRFIPDHVRDYGPEFCQLTAQWCVQGRDHGVVALGMGGGEQGHPASLCADAIRWVQAQGLPFVPHAGEAVGPEGVWDALQFNPPRIGHGVRAAEDPELVAYLREKRIVLEVCPTSNLRTGCIPSWDEHPLRHLWDAGVLLTINSDDPPMFNTSLLDEYRVAVTQFGFTADDLARLSMNAARASLLPAERRERLVETFKKEIQEAFSKNGLPLSAAALEPLPPS